MKGVVVKFLVANALIWAIAVTATFLIVRDSAVVTKLSVVYAVCSICSVTIVRWALGSSRAV